MGIQANLRGVEVFESGEPFPPGIYKFEIEEARPGISQAQNPTLKILVKCLATLSDGESVRFVGKKLGRSYVTAGEGVFRLKRLLLAVGYRAEDLDDDLEIELDDLLGLAFWAFVRTAERPDGAGNGVDVVEHFGEVAANEEAQLQARLQAPATAPGGGAATSAPTMTAQSPIMATTGVTSKRLGPPRT